MNCLNMSLVIKGMFISLLFSIFVWQFAIPSFNKYLYSGSMEDVKWVDREPDDSPAITFCAVNNKSLYGWKQTKEELESTHVSAVDHHCNKPDLVEHAEECVERETFNLTETIKMIRVPNLEIQTLIVTPQKSFWRQEFVDLFLGIVIECVW